jgi:hypothetical protein
MASTADADYEPVQVMVNGLVVGALRARSYLESFAFLPAKPAY